MRRRRKNFLENASIFLHLSFLSRFLSIVSVCVPKVHMNFHLSISNLEKRFCLYMIIKTVLKMRVHVHAYIPRSISFPHRIISVAITPAFFFEWPVRCCCTLVECIHRCTGFTFMFIFPPSYGLPYRPKMTTAKFTVKVYLFLRWNHWSSFSPLSQFDNLFRTMEMHDA